MYRATKLSCGLASGLPFRAGHLVDPCILQLRQFMDFMDVSVVSLAVTGSLPLFPDPVLERGGQRPLREIGPGLGCDRRHQVSLLRV
jgi:hypothetical protein